MKKKILLMAILAIAALAVQAQKAPYKVVVDVTSSDTLVHQMVVRWIGEITASDPKAEVEVVLYAGSLPMVTQDRSTVAAALARYTANKQVSLRACEIAMKNKHVTKDQLLPGIGTVPDGIYEIVQRQHDGWGYIKAAQ